MTTPAVLTVKLSQSDIHWKNGTADAPTVTVLLTAEDGTISEVTDRATFTTLPAEIGDVDAKLLVPTGAMAGAGILSATVDNTLGSVDFKVFVEETVAGTAPAGTDALFDAATPDTAQTLTVAYPPAGAVIPPNLGQMEVHWTDPSAKDVYEVTLSGAFVTLKTYVNRLSAAPGTWNILPEAYWTKLSSGASGVDLDVRVRALATSAPSTYIEGSEKVRIAAEGVKGGLYYWNTSKAAIMRFDMTMPGMTAEQFYPQVGQADGGCVGCHAVSKDGSVVAYRQEGDNMNYGNVLTVSSLTKQLTPNTQQWNFAAIHPNNIDMFTTETSGLYRTDLTTQVKTPVYTTQRMSQPDVSNDGNSIVVSQVNLGNEVWTEGSKLVVFAYDKVAKTVGAPRTLVDQAAGLFPYYPSFSPNDEWVLYNQAPVGGGSSSYDNPNAQLWVTRADGTGTPIHLTAAEVAGASNSWPKFTPFVTHEPTATGAETVIWFTTASRRGFGVRSTTGAQVPQLWLAPFYPERAAAGLPATAPAVRLPFQALGEGNHIAQWTQQIIDIQ